MNIKSIFEYFCHSLILLFLIILSQSLFGKDLMEARDPEWLPKTFYIPLFLYSLYVLKNQTLKENITKYFIKNRYIYLIFYLFSSLSIPLLLFTISFLLEIPLSIIITEITDIFTEARYYYDSSNSHVRFYWFSIIVSMVSSTSTHLCKTIKY